MSLGEGKRKEKDNYFLNISDFLHITLCQLEKEKPSFPPLFLLYFHTTTTLKTFLTPDVWRLSPQQAILCDASWISYSLTQS